MKNRLLGNIFSSGLQAFAVQVLGVVFFLVVSLYLPKSDFGIINWANALAVMLTGILSFGLDQIIVRRIAASKSSDWAAAAYFFHAFAGAFITLGVLLVLSFTFKDSVKLHYLPWFFLAQSIIYIATPLKLYLNAKQVFAPYAVIALVSNLFKVALVFFCVYFEKANINSIYIVLIICSIIELAGILGYLKIKTDFRFGFRRSAYPKLLKESLPQYLSVIFDSSLSRIDWVLLGILSTSSITAEYSVAYKAYEVGRLPVMVIAPILLAKFANLLSPANYLDEVTKKQIDKLFSVEIYLAMVLPLVFNILWTPVLDKIFSGEYGHVNAIAFMILSICIPLQFAINILWTLTFSCKKYKQVSIITVCSAMSNLILNVILIPIWGGEGAAMAFLGTSIIQVGIYYYYVRKSILTLSVRPVIVFLLVAIIAYVVALYITTNIVLRILIAVAIYFVLPFLCRQISKADFISSRKLLER